MNTVLSSTKELLGIPSDVTDFDNELIVYINMVFAILNQLGIGPSTPYNVTLTEGSLEDFIADESMHGIIQMYIYTKVRILFDPPASSFVLTALDASIKEYEWRLTDYTSS